MIREMQEKLGKEFEALSHELTVTLPKAIAQGTGWAWGPASP